MSEHTKSDILDAAVSVMLTSFYCGLGVYSQRLAYRLLIHPKILDMLRLHSKRVIKLNSAFLVFVLFSSFVTLFNISSINNTFKFNKNFSFPDLVTNNTKKLTNINPCQIVGLQVQICQVRLQVTTFILLISYFFRHSGSAKWFTLSSFSFGISWWP